MKPSKLLDADVNRGECLLIDLLVFLGIDALQFHIVLINGRRPFFLV